jgi:hypothetical protein
MKEGREEMKEGHGRMAIILSFLPFLFWSVESQTFLTGIMGNLLGKSDSKAGCPIFPTTITTTTTTTTEEERKQRGGGGGGEERK